MPRRKRKKKRGVKHSNEQLEPSGSRPKSSEAGMLFVVGSSSGADGRSSDFNLRHELNLVKAALLYADRVKLVSVGASMLSGWVELRDVPRQKRLDLMRRHGGHLLTPDQLEKMDQVVGTGSRARKGSLNDRERFQARIQLQAVAEQWWQKLVPSVEDQFESYNARGLREAVASRLVELHSFAYTDLEGLLTMAADKVPIDVAVEDVMYEYVDQASIAIEGSGYPLFDDVIGKLVGEAVRKGLIVPSPSGVHRSRHGGLSGDLMSRLPLFERATVEEVLSVRHELKEHLRGFRRAVSDFSRQVGSAGWEPGFAGEADVLFREKVEPEVEAIEEAVRENRSLKDLAWRTARYGSTPATIGALFGSANALASLAGVALGLGSGAVRSLLDSREKGKEIEGNQLYFYYRARKLFG